MEANDTARAIIMLHRAIFDFRAMLGCCRSRGRHGQVSSTSRPARKCDSTILSMGGKLKRLRLGEENRRIASSHHSNHLALFIYRPGAQHHHCCFLTFCKHRMIAGLPHVCTGRANRTGRTGPRHVVRESLQTRAGWISILPLEWLQNAP